MAIIPAPEESGRNRPAHTDAMKKRVAVFFKENRFALHR
jgi:hypothetical protein